MSGWNLQTRKSVALLLQIHISRNPDKSAQLEVYLLVFQSFDKQFVYNAGTAVPFLVGMDKGYFIFCA